MGVIFNKLFINMTSTNQVEQEEDIEPFDTDPLAHNLIFNCKSVSSNAIQIDVGDQTHMKLLSISKSLSPIEKQGLISLIREYIEVFAWSYEDMSGLDP